MRFDVVVRETRTVITLTRFLLPGCHTQAKSLDELMIRIKEAILLCLETEGSSQSEQLCGSANC